MLNRFQLAFNRSSATVTIDEEDDCLYIWDWIYYGKEHPVKQRIATVDRYLKYEFVDEFNLSSLGVEVQNTIVPETSPEEQRRFFIRQHTLFLIELAFTLFPLASLSKDSAHSKR